MKNIFDIILENFQLFLTGLFCLLICFMKGQFGWALIIGIVMIIVLLVIVVIYWRDKRDSKRNFKKWTRGK